MFSLFLFELRVRTSAIIGWGLGLSAFAFIYLPFYPSAFDQFSKIDFDSIALYQALGNFDMTSFEGYFASTVLQFFAVLFAIFAVVNGTGTLAGEEDAGTLELIAAMPLSRWQVVLSKASAMIVATALILVISGFFVMAGVAFVGSQVEIEITPMDSIPAIWNSFPITICFLMINLFLGASLPNRRIASTIGTVVIIFSYFGTNLSGLIESLEPLGPFLPFYYYDSTAAVFTGGVDWGNVRILLIAALVFLVLAIIAFQRRNLTVGAWFWQRARPPA